MSKKTNYMTSLMSNPLHIYGIGLLLLLVLWPDLLFAQQTLPPNTTCSSNPNLVNLGQQSGGIVTAVVVQVQTLLESIGDQLFNQIVNDTDFQAVVSAALALAVIFYGVLVVFDMADFTPGDILLRMLKIGVVAWITLPGGGGWDFFSNTLGQFLWGTMTELINLFTCTATATATGASGCLGSAASTGPLLSPGNLAQPLSIFNSSVGGVFSWHFFVTILGTAGTGGYGFLMALFILWGAGTFIFALLDALYTYIKTMVGLWFLFSITPIFVILLLFQRTSRLFDGFINLMVGMALEAVLLFAFLAFFIVIISATLENLLLVEWCWLPVFDIIWDWQFKWWRPVSLNNGAVEIADKMGEWNLNGKKDTNGNTVLFPLKMIDALFFLMASHITWQYSSFVGTLAGELTSSGMRMGGSGEAMRQWFRSRGYGGDQMAMRASGRIFKARR